MSDSPKETIKLADEYDDLSEVVNLHDIHSIAKEKMPPMAYEYVDSGAADELTVRWNREALDKLKLLPRILKDVTQLNTKVSLFGTELPYPILIAPTAYHRLYHPEGELATAKGAGAASALYVISSYTNTPLEEIAKAATQPLWFQLYVQNDRELTKDLVLKAVANGCKAICVTVDTPIPGPRDRQIKAKFRLPSHISNVYIKDLLIGGVNQGALKNVPFTWKDIEWIQSFSTVPVLLKGVLNPIDAEEAIQVGASGIIVSNHGGRNLDTVPATAEVLPHIAEVVAGRVPLLMDGGIRRGTDVLKALALGANAVLVGRPICYGLSAGGAEGVAKVMNILRTEFEMAMALTGRATLESIDRSILLS